jgi:chromosome segregation ATPase
MSLEQQIEKESERFQALFSRLSDTQWSEAVVPEAESHLDACQSQARLTQNKINAFNAAADKEHKRLVDIKGHGVRHAWYKVRGKLEQRLDEQENTWLREFEKCKEEEQRLAVLKEEIYSAQKHLHQCQGAYEEYAKTKQALDGLLEHFFSGVTPSYPDEDAMEQNLKREEEHLTTLQNYHRVFTNVFHLLQKAHQAVTVSRRELDDALDMNSFDLFSHSSFADMAVSSHLAKARDASAQAQQFINEARRVYPNMPDIGELHIKQDNLVFNIMFDNIWTDMNMRQMIHEASNRISRADAVLVGILLGIKEKLEKCEADRDKTSKDVKRLAAEHFSARVTIVQNIIEPPPPYSSV